MEHNVQQRSNLDLCIIASSNDLPRLPNTIKFIPNVDNIYILENQKSDNEEESLTLVHSNGKIHHYLWKWVDSDFHFANARNKVFSLSDNEWIFWMDCDDSLHPSDCEWINNNLSTVPNDIGAVMFGCAGLAHFEDATLDEISEIEGLATENWGYWSSPTIRILRRSITNWVGRVHEQVLDSIYKAGYKLMISDMIVKHRGYVTTIDTYISKMERNERLLKMQLDESDDYDSIYMGYLHNTQRSLKGLRELKDKKLKQSLNPA